MTASLPPGVRAVPLPYEAALDLRPLEQIDLVVIHCTELPDLAMAREYGERVLYPATDSTQASGGGTGNSGHYYIDRDGGTQQWVAPERIAHHTRGYNPRSIGIELVNTGRYPHWLAAGHQAMTEPYSDAQLTALLTLLQHLSTTLPALRLVAGHEDLDTTLVPASDDPARQVPRKRDPGPLFPWARVLGSVRLRRLHP